MMVGQLFFTTLNTWANTWRKKYSATGAYNRDYIIHSFGAWDRSSLTPPNTLPLWPLMGMGVAICLYSPAVPPAPTQVNTNQTPEASKNNLD
jgi:hypothetical protein